jgi:hypothetical protein
MSIRRDEVAASGFALLAMTGCVVSDVLVKICHKPVAGKGVFLQEFWVHDTRLKTVGVMSPKLGRRRDMILNSQELSYVSQRRRNERGKEDILSPPRLRRGVSGIIPAYWLLVAGYL